MCRDLLELTFDQSFCPNNAARFVRRWSVPKMRAICSNCDGTIGIGTHKKC